MWRLYAALILLIVALAGMLAGLWFKTRQMPRPAPQTVVAYLDVGDGDCTLIRTVDGRTILLDAGSAQAGPSIVRTLKSKAWNVRAIDLLVLTSPDEGSIGGVPAILAALPVSWVWDNAVAGGGEERRQALEAMRRRHIKSSIVHAGKKLQIGASTFFSVLWPPEHGPRARQDALICQLDFGETRFVFAGAAAGETPGYFVADVGEDLACETQCTDLILQVPDGGSAAGTSPELLRRTAPSVAVISCSGQVPPAPLTLHRLEVAGAEIRRTDTMGTVIVRTDGRTGPTVTATGQ